MIVDSFAGGGGASLGIEMALGCSPDIAINHDPIALAMHQVNHPDCLHLTENVWKVDLSEYNNGEKVRLLWASPDCRDFSKAKGGKPTSKSVRMLAWCLVRFVHDLRSNKPDVICLENVEEFQLWEDFSRWKSELRRYGYKIDLRELRACDYGVPTIRKRLFIIMRSDGRPIVWPKPTHGAPGSPAVLAGKLLPYEQFGDYIDWSQPCPSIFDSEERIKELYGLRAKRPLAPNTLKRVAKGVVKYTLNSSEPFLVNLSHGESGGRREYPLDEPATTVTTSREKAIVTPFIGNVANSKTTGRGPNVWPPEEPLRTLTTNPGFPLVAPVITAAQHGGSTRSAAYPIHTITASGKDQNSLIAASLATMGYGEKPGQSPRTQNLRDPLNTITAGGEKAAVVSAHISRQFGNSVGSTPFDPVGTITARGGGKAGLVSAFLAQHNTERQGYNPGRSAALPLATITTRGTQTQLVASNLLSLKGNDRRDSSLHEPHPTVLAGGFHSAEIRAFLTQYYGPEYMGAQHYTSSPDLRRNNSPVLVFVNGAVYCIADIGMRMLTPRELFRAQGFPDTYIIDVKPDGSPLTKTQQIHKCGNSVCPPLVAAIIRANCGYLSTKRFAA